ncbi:monovalent cation/H(+) antiporter subunit G [bacterium]|nr:monovalent cation/H(+) antiporter subunit G [bacterium]
MMAWITIIAAVFGVFFMLLASIGILRMPDVYLRSQTSTLAPTFGKIGVLLALAAHFEGADVTAKACLVILFLFITAPIAAHLILRAAYHDRAPLADITVRDDYKSQN